MTLLIQFRMTRVNVYFLVMSRRGQLAPSIMMCRGPIRKFGKVLDIISMVVIGRHFDALDSD